MNKEEIKVMIKDGVYSEDGITYMSDKQYNNYINIIEQLQEENQELKDNWNKLKEIIDVKMYNNEYLLKLCGYKVDADTLAILKIIKEEMQELEN